MVFNQNFTALTTIRSTNSSEQPFNILSHLAKKWNISTAALVVIGITFCLCLLLILGFILYLLKQKNENSKKTWLLKKDNQILLLDDDDDRYESPYGYIDMTIMYEQKQKILKIQNLTVCNINKIDQDVPDCYVKAFMKNKDGKKIHSRKTKTINDNINPTFPEVLSFAIDDLDEGVIYFQLFDENKNGNDCPMGDGELFLTSVPKELYIGLYHVVFVKLNAPSEVLGCGDVCVILTYNLPKLSITVLEAKDLIFQLSQRSGKHIKKYPNVYAVVKIFVSGHKKKTFKTSSMENTVNPYFYESFAVTVNARDLQQSVIKVELHEYVPSKISKRIGRACIGNRMFNPFVNDLGQQHLDMVVKNPKVPRAMWHALVKG